LSSSTEQAASPPQPEEGAPAPAQLAGRHNWLATAALGCGILGGTLITIPAGLVLGVLGLRRARQARQAGQPGGGRVRCWLAIALTLPTTVNGAPFAERSVLILLAAVLIGLTFVIVRRRDA